jgi:hypothetical protein
MWCYFSLFNKGTQIYDTNSSCREILSGSYQYHLNINTSFDMLEIGFCNNEINPDIIPYIEKYLYDSFFKNTFPSVEIKCIKKHAHYYNTITFQFSNIEQNSRPSRYFMSWLIFFGKYLIGRFPKDGLNLKQIYNRIAESSFNYFRYSLQKRLYYFLYTKFILDHPENVFIMDTGFNSNGPSTYVSYAMSKIPEKKEIFLNSIKETIDSIDLNTDQNTDVQRKREDLINYMKTYLETNTGATNAL